MPYQPAAVRRPAGAVAAAAAVAAVATLLVAAPALADEQRLVAVSPGNGDYVTAVPEQVRLTFAEPLDGFSVRVLVHTPAGSQPVAAHVEGAEATFSAPHEGPGHYVVDYVVTPGEARGQTGYTVLAPGQSAPAAQRPSPLWAVAAALVVLGLGLVVAKVVRLWRPS